MTIYLEWLATQLFPGKFPKVALPFNPKYEDNYFVDNVLNQPGGVKILHPDFMDYINTKWFTPENRTPMDYPSTGFKTIILALHMCDEVDVFGFGANYKTGTWDHYYDKGEPLTGYPRLHRASWQETFLEKMQRHGLIRIYYGD